MTSLKDAAAIGQVRGTSLDYPLQVRVLLDGFKVSNQQTGKAADVCESNPRPTPRARVLGKRQY